MVVTLRKLDWQAHAPTAPRSNSCPVGCSPSRKGFVSPSHPFERFHRCLRFDNALLYACSLAKWVASSYG
jgi:hypothetical protein